MNKFNFINNKPSAITEIVDIEFLDKTDEQIEEDITTILFKPKSYIKEDISVSITILNNLFGSNPLSLEHVSLKSFLQALSILTIKQKLRLTDRLIIACFNYMQAIGVRRTKEDKKSIDAYTVILEEKCSGLEKEISRLDKRIKDFERRDANNLSDYQALDSKIERLIMAMADRNIVTSDTQSYIDNEYKEKTTIDKMREELNKVIWILNNGFNMEDAMVKASIKKAGYVNLSLPFNTDSGSYMSIPLDSRLQSNGDFLKEIYP